MKKGTILVIDDEKDLVELLRYNLEKEGFDVIGAADGSSGMEIARDHRPDVIVLDLMMPGVDGLEVCRRLRAEPKTAAVPIIMLTAKSSEADRVVGLELGADDYVTKPFSPREMVARVKAVLRRASRGQETSQVHRHGELQIDVDRREVTYRSRRISVTATEFRILCALAGSPGRVLSRDEIIERALERDTAVTDRTIDVHVTALRRKLGKGGGYIETVRGFGYRFRD